MNIFYFDNGIHQYLSRSHPTKKEKKRIERLIESIGTKCGYNLFEETEQGFTQLWMPGLYLERLSIGKYLLTNILKNFKPNYPDAKYSDEKISNWFDDLQKKIQEKAQELLEKVSFEDLIKKKKPGYAGGCLLKDLFHRYTPNEIKTYLITYLSAEAQQQVLMKLPDQKIRKEMFYSCLKGYLDNFFEAKMNLNITRLILDNDSISKGIYKNKKERLIDPNKDLGDNELIYLALFGAWQNKSLYPITGVTFDEHHKIKKRLISVKTIIPLSIDYNENFKDLNSGKILCVDPDSHEIRVLDARKISNDLESL